MAEATSEVLKPGELIRPQVSLDTARGLVERLYGMKVKSIKELVSYDDRNFKITVEDTWDNPHVTHLHPHGYTLKILNRKDSPNNHVEVEHQLIKMLVASGISVIEPVPNVHGKDLSRERLVIEAQQGEKWAENNDAPERPSAINLVRLLTFIPGVTLHKVPYTPAILYEAGSLLGRVNKAWQGFSHSVLTHMKTIWSLKCLPDLRPFLYAVTDEKHKQIVTEVIDAFEKEIQPNYDKYRKGVIHGDFNEQNLIVAERPSAEQTDTDKYSIATIIDFGDSHEAYVVMDVAIAIMYLMVDNTFMDPLDVGGHVLGGFQKYNQLSDDEFDALRVLVAGRFCQSLVMGAYSYMQDPGNDYLLVTAARGWDRLGKLWETPKEKLYTRWRDIRKTYE